MEKYKTRVAYHFEVERLRPGCKLQGQGLRTSVQNFETDGGARWRLPPFDAF